MNAIITINDIKEFKGISSNINSIKDLDPHIIETQDFELRAFLGDGFLIALMADFNASPSLDTYSDLFNGGVYTYGGKQYEHAGLKAIIVYHSYARFLSHSGIQSTPSGFVKKSTQYSEPLEDKTISRLIAQARSAANIHENRVRDYINRNISLYPLWLQGCKTNNNYKSGMKIRKIG